MDAVIIQKLIDTAKRAAKNAYCPYSEYAVGAAVMTDDGNIYDGCNIENASYSLTICAERVALFKAIADGHKKIIAVCVYSDGGKLPYPCGACRQTLSEFAEDACVVVTDGKEEICTTLKALLPNKF